MTSIRCFASAISTCTLALALALPMLAAAAPDDPTTPSPGAGPGEIRSGVVDKLRELPRVECVLVGPLVPNQSQATLRVRNSGSVPIAAGRTVAWTVNGTPPRSGELVLAVALQPNDMLVAGSLAYPLTATCSARIK